MFSIRRASKDGLMQWCKDCCSEYRQSNKEKINARQKVYRDANRERVREWDKQTSRRSTLAKYGLTEERFEEMKTAQRGACMICSKIPEDTLVVDHCHATGQVRGLLCRKHNAALGAFDDDPMMLLNAIEYLKLSRQGE